MITYIKNPNLDQKQQNFVDLVIKQKQNGYLIGPPGTGKTTTLQAVVTDFHKQNCSKSKCICYKILYLSFNNSVTNNIKQRFKPSKTQPTIKTFHGYFNLSNNMVKIWYKNNDYKQGFRDDVNQWLLNHPDQINVERFKDALIHFYEFNPDHNIKNIDYHNIKQLIESIKKLAQRDLTTFKQLVIDYPNKQNSKDNNEQTKRRSFWRFHLLMIDEVQDLQPFMVLIIGFLQWITTLQYWKPEYQKLQIICAGDPYQLINQGRGAHKILLDEFIKLNQMKQIQLVNSYRYNQSSANTINSLVAYQEPIIGLNKNQNKSQWHIVCDYYDFNEDKHLNLLKEIQKCCPYNKKTNQYEFKLNAYRNFLQKHRNNSMIQSTLYGVNLFLETLKTEFNNDWKRVNILSFNNDDKEDAKNTTDLMTKLFKTILLCQLFKQKQQPPPILMKNMENKKHYLPQFINLKDEKMISFF